MAIEFKKNSPFAPDSSNYFLPWMVMIMVFLSTLCFSLGISLEKILSKWENSITGSITIQVLPSQREMEDKPLFLRNVEALVVSLQGTPGIKDARMLEEQEISRLLSPWFGKNELINDLPIPMVIDVTLADDMPIDLDVLKSLISYQAANASIDIHRAWLKRLTSLIGSVKVLALAILIVILTTTAVLVIYATTTTVSLHKKVIGLLHLMGARDNYIAMQISLRALFLSLKGALIGFALVIPIIFTIGHFVRGFDRPLSATISLDIKDWITLLSCVILACVISGISAYTTVIKRLKQML